MLSLVRVLLMCCLVGLTWHVRAEVPVPVLTGHVIDQTSTLTSDQIRTLDQYLRALEVRKGSQVAVLLIPTTQPETIEQYGIRVADKWKLGRRKVDDGVILIVAKNDRTVRIEVGYGLEGALTDALSKRIIEGAILPAFRQQNFYGGIYAGVELIQKVIDGEPLPPPQSSAEEEGILTYLPVLFVIGLFLGSFLRRMFGRLIGAGIAGAVVAIIGWIMAEALLISLAGGLITFFLTLFGGGLGRGFSSGYPGGRGPGGPGMGGGSGGGMSGGGGGFGGGGSSGRW